MTKWKRPKYFVCVAYAGGARIDLPAYTDGEASAMQHMAQNIKENVKGLIRRVWTESAP